MEDRERRTEGGVGQREEGRGRRVQTKGDREKGIEEIGQREERMRRSEDRETEGRQQREERGRRTKMTNTTSSSPYAHICSLPLTCAANSPTASPGSTTERRHLSCTRDLNLSGVTSTPFLHKGKTHPTAHFMHACRKHADTDATHLVVVADSLKFLLFSVNEFTSDSSLSGMAPKCL